jgi:glycosyltransferase involved in cell wall biosynthesis
VFDAENASLSASDGKRVGVRCAPQPSTINHQLPPASFTGFLNQSELSAAYVAADVLVLPSDGGETWGLVVNEAMASGLPAIVSDTVGCTPDLTEEGKTGFSYPVGNAAALAERLERLAGMQDCHFYFSTELSQKLTHYSVKAAVEGTLQAVRRLL